MQAEPAVAREAWSATDVRSVVSRLSAAFPETVEGIKAALRHLGHGTGALRMPAPDVPPAALERIARLARPVAVG